MRSFDFIAVMLGMRSHRYNFGGGGQSAGPTPQQVALQTEQALTNSNLNLEENEQRKTILNAQQGTRVFRGSALSRQIASNTAATTTPPQAPSASQQNPTLTPRVAVTGASLLDQQNEASSLSPARGAPAANPGRPITPGR